MPISFMGIKSVLNYLIQYIFFSIKGIFLKNIFKVRIESK